RRTAFRNQPNSSQSPREDVVNVDMQVPSPPNPPDSSSPNIHKTVTPDGQSYNNIYFNDFGIGNNVYESVLDHYDRPISLTRDNQGYDIPLPSRLVPLNVDSNINYLTTTDTHSNSNHATSLFRLASQHAIAAEGEAAAVVTASVKASATASSSGESEGTDEAAQAVAKLVLVLAAAAAVESTAVAASAVAS
ncbi:hypothetical protein PoB_002667000, partial [Plakobranchus ocellatus]